MPATIDKELNIVLKPLSRQALGEIRIEGSVFAVGRTEPAFASYGPDILVMLSRRHARIFCEAGIAYVADLDSRNGTTVNRARVAQAPCKVNSGDEICFGGVLSYRVEITRRTTASRPEVFTLTLTPESSDATLDPIVITRFPYLVSKTDAAFSRYRNGHSQELGYLSRRHAHIFRKGGKAYIEDLASTNGTFVDGERLRDVAMPLTDGVLLSFGGHHFTYRVSIPDEPQDTVPVAPTLAQPCTAQMAPEKAAPEKATQEKATESDPAKAGKTTFVVAPTSFLDIFCIDRDAGERADANQTLPAPAVHECARARHRQAALWTAVAAAFVGSDRDRVRRSLWRGAALAGILCAIAVAPSLWHAPEREVKDLLDAGEYPRAALLADKSLAKHPEDLELKALATEAALKANVPAWLARTSAGDFEGARAVVAAMSGLGGRNPDLRPLVTELDRLGQLERLVSTRGGPDAPIRIYADEDRIAALIDQWNDDTREHQRALARIASHVPQFGAPYAEALTHLRKLQSEATVHLAAIQRLKATIASEMNRDRPEALEPVLEEYAQKYPALGGLDSVRQDLGRYVALRNEARARPPARLFALLLKARFATPPFQEGFRALMASGQLPPAELVSQYAAATQAWKEGHANQALDGLQKMAAGPWAQAATKEIERRQAIVAQFEALQHQRTTGGYVEQLLDFRATLDADEDVHYARATQGDLVQHRQEVLARAEDFLNRSRASWNLYRNNGAIESSQRIESAISNEFRTRARWLSEASRYAQQAMQIYAQVNVARPEQWAAIQDEIRAEAAQQRNALLELRKVLEPELLKAKLALMGDPQ